MTDQSTDGKEVLTPDVAKQTPDQVVDDVQDTQPTIQFSKKGLMEAVRYVLTKPRKINPELKTWYYPFPISKKVVVNFKTWVFLAEAGKHKEFQNSVMSVLSDLGYKAKEQNSTYSPGLIAGVARELVQVPLDKAEAAIFFKDFGDLLYVSLRVAYQSSISLLRLILFFALCVFPPFLVYQGIVEVNSWSNDYGGICSDYNYCSYNQSDIKWFINQIITNVLVLGIFFSIVSFIRGGGFLGWLYADYDELYRDDMATVWNMSELAIISTADEMDLEQVPVGEDFSQNSLQHTQLPKRRPRF